MKFIIVIDRDANATSVFRDLDKDNVKVVRQLRHMDGTYIVEAKKKPKHKDILAISPENKKIKTIPAEIPPWHLRRIVTKSLPLRDKYDPLYTGKGVVVYMLDSLPDLSHKEFENKDVSVFGKPDLSSIKKDSHGTAMASLIVGNTVGVAKNATLKAVDVDNISSVKELIELLEEVLEDHMQTPDDTKVINISWITKRDKLIDLKIDELRRKNIVTVCAAGNEGKPVNLYSPAGNTRVLTIGASDEFDRVAKFNSTEVNSNDVVINYGDEIDMYAPGIEVAVASNDDFSFSSGTSVSSAIVAGVAAQYIEKYKDYNAKEISQLLVSESLKGLLHFENNEHESNNRLVYTYNKYYKEVWKETFIDLGELVVGEELNIPVKINDEVNIVDYYTPKYALIPKGIKLNLEEKTLTGVLDIETKEPVLVEFIIILVDDEGSHYPATFSFVALPDKSHSGNYDKEELMCGCFEEVEGSEVASLEKFIVYETLLTTYKF